MSDKPASQMGRLLPHEVVKALSALSVSFVVTSILGGAAIYEGAKNLPGLDARSAMDRAIAFPFIMLFIYVAGYRVWRLPFSPYGMGREQTLAAHRHPAKAAVVQQLICVFIAALVLDLGIFWHATWVAVLAYWLAVAVIVARRPETPTRGDIFFVRYCFLAVWILVLIAGPIIWNRIWQS